MASIECGRGHLYNPEQHPTCPYCNTSSQISVSAAGKTAPISVTAAQKTAPISVTAASKTAPLSGARVTDSLKTMPPQGYGAAVASSPPSTHSGISVMASGKTLGMMQAQMGFEPVVGWLACTAGASRGKSYTIRAGINSIGRGDRMDITITGDMKISAENHVKISYSDKNNRFNLLPGEGRNIVYLNDEEVFMPMPLAAYDLIDFGETKLLFVPLCGERFTWGEEKGGSDGAV